ncbi:hypothetical protein [Parvularcula dongshanensis]|uniref:Uncharacterized protein n=1 Tax=Parvularcula dongshanensis TaxID=1173995 RepID=A0A840I2W3_9PROT|nr:hypothetical protein [Parvularcula dongshanensis]MBB4658528.1 hypothetical protein [Parvularcula dongshanensis]
MSEHPKIREDEHSVFERPRTIRIIWIVLIASCVLFAALGFVLAAMHEMHPHFTADAFPAFYAVVGFVSFAFIVLAGQHLRRILMRPEGYYDGAEAELPHNPVADDAVRVTDMDEAKA